jgi:uncharacterized protein YndB with AHSA1/START domain
MTARPIVHGSFTIDRTFTAPVQRVFAAWADVETKAQWFIGPPDRWTLLRRELDLRAGGVEVLHGKFGATETLFTARYHEILPDERLVYAYDMHVGGKHLSTSLATVELAPAGDGGTRMTFTEQAAFLDGEDGTRSREGGTAAHLDRLASALAEPREIVSTRVLDAPRDAVFAAYNDPARLVAWWGPKGFTNRFRRFELRAGGTWELTMLGPDGTSYELVKEFVDVTPPDRIVLRQLTGAHAFTMTMTFVDLGPRTHLVWRMRFDSAREVEQFGAAILRANDENFDRLAAHLAASR